MPPKSSADLAHTPYRCDYPGCKAQYRRKEHLNRHAAHHSQEDSFSDLLRRHIRIYHPDRQPPSSRAQKACWACHERKERCRGGIPCISCQKRVIDCSPPNAEPQGACVVDKNVQTKNRLAVLVKSSRWIADDYVDIYFKEFHPKWPFLHRATFDLSTEPCVLIQSIAMVGLWMEGSPKSQDAAMDFHNSLCAAIRSQRDRWQILDMSPRISWPMPTYQSILLQTIFALFRAGQRGTFDVNFRYLIEPDEYELLVALVQSCRLGGIFSYPNMLAHQSAITTPALLWVTVEEIKRFGLALYKVCRMTSCVVSAAAHADGDRSELLTLADLCFGLPDSDEVWNIPPGTGTEVFRNIASQSKLRDNLDPTGWISQSSSVLYDAGILFDWI
ncbi:hypothetical protein BDW71DRAFT_217004 [Aspergillus fruticulosus]